MRVLVFGDSITQGYWAVEHGWVDRLRMYYDARQIEDLDGRDEPTFFNLGISADASTDILSRIVDEMEARVRPHHSIKPVALVQIGINDSCREPKEHKVPLESYKQNLKNIVSSIEKLCSKIVFVGSSACNEKKTTPVSWGEYYYRNEDIKLYEDMMSTVANELGAEFIPVFEEFKAQLDKGMDLLPDGLHPNDEGHELIYQIVKPKLEELLV